MICSDGNNASSQHPLIYFHNDILIFSVLWKALLNKSPPPLPAVPQQRASGCGARQDSQLCTSPCRAGPESVVWGGKQQLPGEWCRAGQPSPPQHRRPHQHKCLCQDQHKWGSAQGGEFNICDISLSQLCI